MKVALAPGEIGKNATDFTARPAALQPRLFLGAGVFARFGDNKSHVLIKSMRHRSKRYQSAIEWISGRERPCSQASRIFDTKY
jgi:hypothetical protein